eukprot:CAMPEP_0202901526 /NCGR_PEP_ID=MMETSP1392-20130828/14302_1 /ASSEMBLY_ACC=CAM_ASM_000868 /TAXON_ID=225041 /ORGANISM="Chlamydomonas chlamydogama, Strain SAG 11-48b" /LENGTH=410 /DNA_ID=CAMNT_0049588099 /DNA_START=245 /DNA_END=1477 /DNA_ORIENTATION=-
MRPESAPRAVGDAHSITLPSAVDARVQELNLQLALTPTPPAAQNSDISQLREQLGTLTTLLETQQRVIDKQQALIDQLRASVTRTKETAPVPPASVSAPSLGWNSKLSPFESQRIGIGDRRLLGLYDARFHSTASGATPKDYRVLPDRIILVRHAESEGNVSNLAYTTIPDSQIPLTARGHEQARKAGMKLRKYIEQKNDQNYKLFFYTSPYKRSLQTYESISSAFAQTNITGVQEEVQLREQDFGNFQDAAGKEREKTERLRFGRFFYRFPNGESGADVYDRITIFEDHMIRDINAGRFGSNSNLVLVTHGLALRVFLMRWFHWTLAQYLCVHNPPNAEPLILERVPNDTDAQPGGAVSWMHTKSLYRLSDESMEVLRGCTEEMCTTSHAPRFLTSSQEEEAEEAKRGI